MLAELVLGGGIHDHHGGHGLVQIPRSVLFSEISLPMCPGLAVLERPPLCGGLGAVPQLVQPSAPTWLPSAENHRTAYIEVHLKYHLIPTPLLWAGCSK